MISITESTNTVDVSIMDTGCKIGNIPAAIFTDPQIPGFEKFEGISYVFVLTHTDSGGKVRRILFDLGARKDWENMAPHVVQATKAIEGAILEPTDNVADLLERGGVDKASIEALIWSHAHVDHVGDPSIFPSSATLIVGPGVKDEYFPGWPTKPDAPVLVTDFANREVRQLDFSDTKLPIGGLLALDYFGDGSRYISSVSESMEAERVERADKVAVPEGLPGGIEYDCLSDLSVSAMTVTCNVRTIDSH